MSLLCRALNRPFVFSGNRAVNLFKLVETERQLVVRNAYACVQDLGLDGFVIGEMAR